MNFRLLEKTDVDKLFQFELDNRTWFEKHIAARDDDFYSKFKVEKHILACLSDHYDQKMYPAVIEAENEIIARVNLRNIDLETKSADIGYRVAKSEIGKGLASHSVGAILEIAKQELCLETISSYVITKNLASQKVLNKHNFKQIKLLKDFAVVSGRNEDCLEYALKIM